MVIKERQLVNVVVINKEQRQIVERKNNQSGKYLPLFLCNKYFLVGFL